MHISHISPATQHTVLSQTVAQVRQASTRAVAAASPQRATSAAQVTPQAV
jgi:hypothetical protein